MRPLDRRQKQLPVVSNSEAPDRLPLSMQVSITAQKPRIGIIGTGGTIAGAGVSTVNTSAYRSAVVAVDRIIAAVPEIEDVADVRGEQIFQIGSESFNNERLLKLAHRVSDLL